MSAMQFICPQQQQLSPFAPQHKPRLVYINEHCQYRDRGDARPMHSHPDMLELLYCLEGRGLHIIDGTAMPTQQGDIIIYNSNVPHDDVYAAEHTEVVCALGITDLAVKGFAENSILPPHASPVLHTGAQHAAFAALFHLIAQHSFPTAPHSSALCQAALDTLLYLLLDFPYEQLSAAQENQTPRLAQIHVMRAFIDAHYAEKITLEQIAAQCHISPYHASHIFKELTGYSPMQYIMRRRIGQAQTLLLTTDISVTDIAGCTGFDNSNYFSTVFAKYTGYTPREYRRELRVEGKK